MKSRRFSAAKVRRSFARLAFDRRGGTAIEYGLIAGLIVVTMIVALVSLADTTTGLWNNISASVRNAH